MKKSKQKALILYGLTILASSSLAFYALHQLVTFSIWSLLISVFIFIFIITAILSFFSNTTKRFRPTYILAIILCISSLYSLVFHPYQKPYRETYMGIDVSKWNGDVNLQNIIFEIDFVIIRCGYTSNIDGTTHKIDEQFHENIKQCKDLGIPYGVYYYSLASTTEAAKEEALYTLSLLDGDIPPLGVYIDIEDETYQGHLSKQELTNIALTFVSTIEEQHNRGGVYANYYWWTTKLDRDTLQPYLKWLAFYSESYTLEDTYHLHQYTDQGTLNGLPGTYDINMAQEKFW